MLPKQEYITIHDHHTPQHKNLAMSRFCFDENLDGNGLAILTPTVARIKEELNGTYELYMEHPIDPDGRWKLLEIDNIVKANGQLFRIIERKTVMDSSGNKVRSVTAMHIWYDLGGIEIDNLKINYYAAKWFLEEIMNAKERMKQAKTYRYFFVNYDFTGTTNCGQLPTDILAYAYYKNSSVVKCLIGSECAFVNLFVKYDADGMTEASPELYRDNFNFSLNWNKEGSVQNAFTIRHKVDMIDVEETYDAKNVYTHLSASDNYGHGTELYINITKMKQQGERYPANMSLKQLNLNYSADENNQYLQSRFLQDAKRYFNTINKPKLTIKCKYAELSNKELYADYIAAKHCNVGDTGTIIHESLGITMTNAKVISKTIDLLDKDNVSIEFGTKMSGIIDSKYMSDTVNNSKFTKTEVFSLVNTD